MAFASALPLIVGVVLRVTPSLLEAPLSDAAASTGAAGTAGALVSTVIARPPDAALALPAVSVALAVSVCAPSASGELTIVHWPLASAVALPRSVAPSLS